MGEEEEEEIIPGAVAKVSCSFGDVGVVGELFLRLNIGKQNCSKLMARVDAEIKSFYLRLSKTEFQSKAV